ncbi:MAG: hypothetical protein ABFD89_06705 [Bryobacteraceae bacterium]
MQHTTKRGTQSFEPCGPIKEMITLELNNRGRGRGVKRGLKTKLFEDCIANALGGKYPKLMDRFKVLREEAA